MDSGPQRIDDGDKTGGMRPGEVRLGIDCGSASTVAVLAWPDGRWEPLLFDGAPTLSSAIHVGADGTPVTGALALQEAIA
jgi:hypothetical protein